MTNGTSGTALTSWEKYKETHKKCASNYRKNNKDKFNHYMRGYYKEYYAQPEQKAKKAEYMKKYITSENGKAVSKAYYQANKEALLAKMKINYAIKKAEKNKDAEE